MIRNSGFGIRVFDFPLSLINRQKLIRQLQNDRPDGRAVDRTDAVAIPAAVGVLHTQKLIARLGEIVVPDLGVGRLVKRLGRIQMRVKLVARALSPLPFCLVKLFENIMQAIVGQLGIIIPGIVKRGDGGGGNRQPGATTRSQ